MDALIALICVGGLLWAFWDVRNPNNPAKIFTWRHFVGAIALLTGLWEVGSLLEVHQTISQQFSAYHAIEQIKGWIAVVLVVVGGVGLALHLGWKQLVKMWKEQTKQNAN